MQKLKLAPGIFILFATLLNVLSQDTDSLVLEWTDSSIGEAPKGFRSAKTGVEGKIGDWKILENKTPEAIFYREDPSELRLRDGRMIQQTSFSAQPDRFPLLLLEDKSFGDFKLVTRFQINGGGLEQMAGVAFRAQDDNNYYVVRASALSSNLSFYRFIDGYPTQPVLTAEAEFEKDQWYTLAIETNGPQISIRLDGKNILPLITDTTFTQGKIGFWTKADSISSFAETWISFKPEFNRFEGALNWILKENRNVKDARILALPNSQSRYQIQKQLEASGTDSDQELKSISDLLSVKASTNTEEIGQSATEFEKRCLDENSPFTAKKNKPKRWVFLVPLHDNNGETFAVMRVEMNRGFGISKRVSLAQALKIGKEIEKKSGLW